MNTIKVLNWVPSFTGKVNAVHSVVRSVSYVTLERCNLRCFIVVWPFEQKYVQNKKLFLKKTFSQVHQNKAKHRSHCHGDGDREGDQVSFPRDNSGDTPFCLFSVFNGKTKLKLSICSVKAAWKSHLRSSAVIQPVDSMIHVSWRHSLSHTCPGRS